MGDIGAAAELRSIVGQHSYLKMEFRDTNSIYLHGYQFGRLEI